MQAENTAVTLGECGEAAATSCGCTVHCSGLSRSLPLLGLPAYYSVRRVQTWLNTFLE